MGGWKINSEQTGKAKPRRGAAVPGSSSGVGTTGPEPIRARAATAKSGRRATGSRPAAAFPDAPSSVLKPVTKKTPASKRLTDEPTGRGFGTLILWLTLMAIGGFILALVYQLEGV